MCDSCTTKKKSTTKKRAARKRAPAKTNVRLEKRVMIGRIDELRSTLDGAKTSKEVLFDGTAVEAIDTASLQLLAAFVTHRRKAKKDVSWEGVSDEFRARAVTVDLDQHLGLGA